MTDPSIAGFVRLDSPETTLILDLGGDEAAILYWGARLDDRVTGEAIAPLIARVVPPSAPTIEPRIALTPLMAAGYIGAPGLAGHRGGVAFAPRPKLTHVTSDGRSAELTAYDSVNALELTHRLALDQVSGVLTATTTLTNHHDEPYWLERLAAPVIPLPIWAADLIAFGGRWAGEFATERLPLSIGSHVRENRRGRTSHDCFPGVIVTSADASERHGEALALHLAASANHFHRVERLADGRGAILFGELLLPGEISLASGESYATPVLHAAIGEDGLSAVSQRLHRFVRARVLPRSVAARPRPVHYNSWEALYFEHDPAVLADLADRAAALGVERFVLDDGWFGARRSDEAGLGDWTVSADVYPQGLAPLIAHVHALGMEFGLWVEPEMVNPDSDLYRAHPDWVLALPGIAQIPARHQYVLDLTHPGVADYLFDRIDALLSDHAIDYLKWDMNRDVNHPGDAAGRAAMHRQTRALYALIDRLRARHPRVEIESCSSGGGRADYAMLTRTERVWTSDSNDAIDRLRIQRGASYFFPAEVLGSHIGPRDCHITERRIDMAMRAGVAMFGAMGLEMDLRELTDAEADTARAAIALHKRHRALIHSGDRVRLDVPVERDAFGIVAADRGEALFSYALLEGHRATMPGRLRLAGLDPARFYRLELVWPPAETAPPHVVSGDALMRIGIELPLLMPQSLLVWHLSAQG